MSFAEVSNLASNLSSAASRNLEELARLKSQAEPGDIWQGNAAQSYESAYLRYDSAQKEMQAALQQLSTAVTTIKDNFEQINMQGAGMFDQMMA